MLKNPSRQKTKKSMVAPDEILDGHSLEIRALSNRLREIIRDAVPDARAVAYPVWHAIGYRHPKAGYFCGIFPYEDHVKVYFEQGRFLSDPDGLLQGGGKQTRYIFLEKTSDLRVRPFKKLLAESLEFRKRK